MIPQSISWLLLDFDSNGDLVPTERNTVYLHRRIRKHLRQNIFRVKHFQSKANLTSVEVICTVIRKWVSQKYGTAWSARLALDI